MRTGKRRSTIRLIDRLYPNLDVGESGGGEIGEHIGCIEKFENDGNLITELRGPHRRVGLKDSATSPDIGELAVPGQGRVQVLVQH